MNLNTLNTEVQDFLKQNLKGLATELVLKKSPFKNVTSKELAIQLVGKQKAQKKLPTWFKNNQIVYPPALNLEQTSSEITAKYKANLVSGNLLVDATGGFGIDSFYFSKKIKTVIHCDLNFDLQKIAAHNFKVLQAENITSYNADGIETAVAQKQIDWLYVDPSRRNESKGKVFFLEDCLPNVPVILEDCFAVAEMILVKTAPILDISAGLKELKNVKEIHVISVDNEVKELLWILKRNFTAETTITASNIQKGELRKIQFPLSAEKNTKTDFIEVSDYLYEPYTSALKTGAFNYLSNYFEVGKLHKNSHLYTSKKQVDFFGRSFKVNSVNPFNKATIKNLGGIKTNVVSRNFKQTVAQLRKKYKLKEGAERYLFFTTDLNNNQIVVDCEKIV